MIKKAAPTHIQAKRAFEAAANRLAPRSGNPHPRCKMPALHSEQAAHSEVHSKGFHRALLRFDHLRALLMGYSEAEPQSEPPHSQVARLDLWGS